MDFLPAWISQRQGYNDRKSPWLARGESTALSLSELSDELEDENTDSEGSARGSAVTSKGSGSTSNRSIDRDVPRILEQSDESKAFEIADRIVTEVLETRDKFTRQALDDFSDDDVTLFVREVQALMSKCLAQVAQEIGDGSGSSPLSLRQAGAITNALDTAEAFEVMMQAAGPRAAKFLECFYLKVDAAKYPISCRRFQYNGTSTTLARGPLHLRGTKDRKDHRDAHVKHRERLFWNQLAKEDPDKNWFKLPADPIKLKEYEFHWIFLPPLVAALGPYEVIGTMQSGGLEEVIIMDLMEKMLSSFLKADNSEYVFETIPARALLKRVEQAVFVQWVLNFFLALVCVVSLIYITYWWNVTPAYLTCVSNVKAWELDAMVCQKVILASVAIILCNIIEILITAADMFLWRYEWISLWSVIDLFLDCASLLLVILLFVTAFLHKKVTEMHSISLPLIIAARWLRMWFYIAYIPNIGRSMLPSILAGISRPSAAIFASIFYMVVAMTHAYFGFRIIEDEKTFGEWGLWGFFQALMRVTRIIMFADGDVDEMAGRRQVLVEEEGTTFFDSEESGHWGQVGKLEGDLVGLSILLGAALLSGVVLMNTWIGVLADKYSEFNEHKFHYFHQYWAPWQMRALRRRGYWSNMPVLGHRCLSGMQSVPAWSSDNDADKGLWVVSAPQPTDEVEELKEKVEAVEESVQDLTAEVIKMNTSVQEIRDMLLMRRH